MAWAWATAIGSTCALTAAPAAAAFVAARLGPRLVS